MSVYTIAPSSRFFRAPSVKSAYGIDCYLF